MSQLKQVGGRRVGSLCAPPVPRASVDSGRMALSVGEAHRPIPAHLGWASLQRNPSYELGVLREVVPPLVSRALDLPAPLPHIGIFLVGHIMNKGQRFIERRSQGDHAVRKPNSDRASIVKPTQARAIDWAKAHNRDGWQILVKRVRNTDCGRPDKWQKP
jgi:hypothetical protein